MRLPIIVCCAIAALTAACDGENGVRITSSTTSDDAQGILKVVETLQCPDSIGALTRKGSAQADGTVCIYTGPRGAEVSLHLVSLENQTADQALKGFETQLLAAMPHTAAQMNASTAQASAEAARADADAARAEADAARIEADGARVEAEAAANADPERASVRAPGLNIDTQGDRASVRMPGIHVEADGDKADVRIGGFTIRANDDTTRIDTPSNQEAVSIQAHDDSAEIRTRAPGEATRQTYLLTDNRPSAAGWRLVGYEARGPRGGPIVVATVRAKERNSDGVFDDAKDLVALNVGD